MPPSEAKTRSDDPLISLVVPVLDEEDCIDEFARRAREAAERAGVRYEILFVDDGSRDATPDRIARLRESDPNVKTIRFTRSFGHQAALAAGLCYAGGDAIVTLDGDLQHPPELLGHWRRGADVVHTLRREPLERRTTWKHRFGRLFHHVISLLSAVPMAAGSADFRLLDRVVVDRFNALGEHFVFVRGLIPWLGFPDAHVEYQAGERFAGTTKYSPVRMTRLALNGIFSFSVLPLRLITLLGLATTLFGVLFGVLWLFSYLLGRVDASNFTSLVILILIFGGVQLLSIGILSEYVGRTYEEVKRRPRYVIDSTGGIDAS
jgi:glycosyltransferase involved in cell wall biosynthesis